MGSKKDYGNWWEQMMPGNTEGSWGYWWMLLRLRKRWAGDEGWMPKAWCEWRGCCPSCCRVALLAMPISLDCSHSHDQVTIPHETPVYRWWGIVSLWEIPFRHFQRNRKVLILHEAKGAWTRGREEESTANCLCCAHRSLPSVQKYPTVAHTHRAAERTPPLIGARSGHRDAA